MDIKKLHEQFKGDDSPSVEGQIRWLQKQGFLQSQIDQAMLIVYGDIERGHFPKVYAKEGVDLKEYRLFDFPLNDSDWRGEAITSGWDLDQVILAVAKRARGKDISALLQNMEKFEAQLRKKWELEKELTPSIKKPGFWKRLFNL